MCRPGLSNFVDSLAQDFVDSLIPITLVYVIAHYFSLLLYQGEVGFRLLSDPWGRGWDIFGTHGFQPNFTMTAAIRA